MTTRTKFPKGTRVELHMHDTRLTGGNGRLGTIISDAPRGPSRDEYFVRWDDGRTHLNRGIDLRPSSASR